MRVRRPAVCNSYKIADHQPRHADQYTRRHEQQQLEKLRKEVRLHPHCPCSSIPGLILLLPQIEAKQAELVRNPLHLRSHPRLN